MQHPGAKREMGGNRFQMGGRALLAPPLAMDLGIAPVATVLVGNRTTRLQAQLFANSLRLVQYYIIS